MSNDARSSGDRILEDFKEAYHEHGAVICDDCNTRVDFDEANSVDEAMGVFHTHVEEVHDGEE